jgi:hypothetical protein
MMRKSCPTTPKARQLLSILSLAIALPALVVMLGACEDKAIGRLCDVQADAGTKQAVFNGQALECPSRICIKPAYEQGAVAKGTTAYCTAECSSDSDCDGATRSGTGDTKCSGGFICAVPFEVGPLCCKKLCVCKDFVDQKLGLPTPASCNKSVSTCQNL